MNNLLVSIIIPSYNRAHLISETLDSIQAQTYENWECIIVDDGSTDNTDQVVRSYVKKDSRFQYHQRPVNRLKGANVCRNYGFELSKGQYIKWFDSDDIMCLDFLERQVAILEKNKDLDFCACFCKVFENDKSNLKEGLNPKDTDIKNALWNYIVGKLFFLTPSALWRNSFLEGKELFDETLFRGQEADFNFRRLIENGVFYYSQEILFLVRRGHASIDSESVQNPKSVQSQFDYFQKIFEYLLKESTQFSLKRRNELLGYVLYRQLNFFYQLRIISNWGVILKCLNIVCKNTFKGALTLKNKCSIGVGLITILLFKKGFDLIHLKELDIREQ